MLNIIKSLKALRNIPTTADIERSYLESSVSLADLERRQREIDRGLFRRNGYDL